MILLSKNHLLIMQKAVKMKTTFLQPFITQFLQEPFALFLQYIQLPAHRHP